MPDHTESPPPASSQLRLEPMRAPAWLCNVLLAWVVGIVVGCSIHTAAAQSLLVSTGDHPARLPAPASAAASPTPAGPAGAPRPQGTNRYRQSPLFFEANHGQLDPQVLFVARGWGYTLFLTLPGATLAVYERPTRATPPPLGQGQLAQAELPAGPSVRMQLVGADPAPRVVGLETLPGKSHYLVGNDPQTWRTHIPHYAKVRYEGIYPGIDLVYHGTQQQVEYDFVVAPGADPTAIRLVFRGVELLRLDETGTLHLQTGGGEILHPTPKIYQEVEGVTQAIPGQYVLHAGLQVGFQVAAYDPTKPLVIDPVFVYSTYLGGVSTASAAQRDVSTGRSIAVDAAGNAYVTGATNAATFPITAGAFQPAPPGFHQDVFVTKFDAAGAVVYSTYLGGSATDEGFGIAVDAAGNAYVTGVTNSADFPTTPGAFQPTKQGGIFDDIFVAKLNATGDALLYATYLGRGSHFGSAGRSIAVDAAGNAYVTGVTDAADFPTTPGAFQPVFRGGFALEQDAFVAKIDPARGGAASLVYATYLGGNREEEGRSIAVDAAGNAYVTGFTMSADFPTTPGALEPASMFGSFGAGFVTKLSAAGDALVYSTLVPFGALGQGAGIAGDAAGNAYVTGFGDRFIETAGAGGPTVGGGTILVGRVTEGKVMTLNPAGTALLATTVLPGPGAAIAVDTAGHAYVTGSATDASFPALNPVQAAHGGAEDAFVVKLNPPGDTLAYTTYLGGRGSDRGLGIAVDAAGNAYVTGSTDSDQFPTARPFQPTRAGLRSAFVTKLSATPAAQADLSVTQSASPTPATVGSHLSYTITVTNHGPAAAVQARLTATASGADFSAELNLSKGCTTFSDPDFPSCGLGTIPPGARVVVVIVVKPGRVGTISSSVSVSSLVLDPNPANNSVLGSTAVTAPAGEAGGHSGGGCSISPGRGFDPTLLGFLGLLLLHMGWRYLRPPGGQCNLSLRGGQGRHSAGRLTVNPSGSSVSVSGEPGRCRGGTVRAATCL